jgi:hypothetical protein
MSNPLDTFKKNRTQWMAALVLLAILSFIVVPAIQMGTGVLSGPTGGNQVMVRWAGGRLTQGNASYLRLQHVRTMNFLESVAREVVAAGGEPKVPLFSQQGGQITSLGLPTYRTDQDMAQAIIISERAKQLGLDFGRPVAEEFLKNFCDGRISNQRLAEILRDVAGRELSPSDLYNQISIMLAHVVMQSNATSGVSWQGSPLVTPGMAWQNFLRTSRVAQVEAYPLKAEAFLSEVQGKPSEAELRAIYDAGQLRFASPNSPEPGFRRRYQANLEYVSGSISKIAEELKGSITEEQIQAEYERLVALGRLQVPVEPTAPPAEPATSDAPATDAPATDAPATDAPATDAPATDAPEAPEPAAANSDAAAEPAVSDQSSTATSSQAVRLVAFQQESAAAGEDGVAPAATTDDAPIADNASPTDVTTTASTDAVAPAQDNIATDAAAETANAPLTQDAELSTDLQLTDPQLTDPQLTDPQLTDPQLTDPQLTGAQPTGGLAGRAEVSGPAMRTKSLEEAREEVINSLAREAARPVMQQRFEEIQKAMREHSTAMSIDLASERDGLSREKVAKPFNLKALAQERGLEYGQTGKVDGLQLAATPLGRSFLGQGNLANMVMWPEVPLYLPVQSIYLNFDGTDFSNMEPIEYASWKTEEQLAYTPEFAAIREEVDLAWRLQQARKLAQAAAEAKARDVAKAADATDPWAQTLDETERPLVVRPLPFTWLTPGDASGGAPRISFVEGLNTVGNEFMEKVFAARAGDYVVAPDEGHNLFYVVRVANLNPPQEVLRQQFSAAPQRAARAQLEAETLIGDWQQSIERALNVQWLAVNNDGQ